MTTTSLAPSAVHVYDYPFVQSHGRAPRGRGGWIFCPERNWGNSDYLDHVKNFNGTYAEARKAAKLHFAALGIRSVVACP